MNSFTSTCEQLSLKMKSLGDESRSSQNSISLLREDTDSAIPYLITPETVALLIDMNVNVYFEKGYSNFSKFKDQDYIDVGAECLEDKVLLFQNSRIVVKFNRFTCDEALLMKKKQILISNVYQTHLSKPLFEIFKEKNISAFSLNYIKDRNDESLFERILEETIDATAISIALSSLIFPLINILIYNHNLHSIIPSNPSLLQSIYCYNGTLCNEEIATLLQMSWKDILSLCWNMN